MASELAVILTPAARTFYRPCETLRPYARRAGGRSTRGLALIIIVPDPSRTFPTLKSLAGSKRTATHIAALLKAYSEATVYFMDMISTYISFCCISFCGCFFSFSWGRFILCLIVFSLHGLVTIIQNLTSLFRGVNFVFSWIFYTFCYVFTLRLIGKKLRMGLQKMTEAFKTNYTRLHVCLISPKG